ncbi:MAG: dTDP-4-dehydrorhamnose reductase [Parashewanella sp.]
MKQTTRPKLLITGANGQVGQALQLMLNQDKDAEFVATDKEQLNVCDLQQVKQVIDEVKPDVIIHAAAYTNVEQAELEPEQAFLVNQLGTEHLAIVSAALDIPIIYLSTDYVFDGNQFVSYQETDKVCPINVYGRSKVAGEQAVFQHNPMHVVVRTSSIFSASGNNFCRTLLQASKTRNELQVVADQVSAPTYVMDLVRALICIAKQLIQQPSNTDKYGTYHYCGATSVSWHALATALFKAQFERNLITSVPIIKAISAVDYASKVSRPPFSGLTCHKIEQAFQLKASNWQAALYEVKFDL